MQLIRNRLRVANARQQQDCRHYRGNTLGNVSWCRLRPVLLDSVETGVGKRDHTSRNQHERNRCGEAKPQQRASEQCRHHRGHYPAIEHQRAQAECARIRLCSADQHAHDTDETQHTDHAGGEHRQRQLRALRRQVMRRCRARARCPRRNRQHVRTPHRRRNQHRSHAHNDQAHYRHPRA